MRNIGWFFGSFVLVILIFFIYNAFYLPIVESKNIVEDKVQLSIDKKSNQKSDVVITNDVSSDVIKEQTENSVIHDIKEDDWDVEEIYISEQEDTSTDTSIGKYVHKQNLYTDEMSHICLVKGGRITLGICEAKFNDAKKICKSMHKQLLTIQQYKNIVTACNGIPTSDDDDRNENSNNIAYQECYRKMGFSPFEYWSSTASKNEAFVVRFNYGSIYLVDINTSYGFVYCEDKSK